MSASQQISPDINPAVILKPCPDLKNIKKKSDLSRALIVSKNAFNRLVDYTTETDRLAEKAANEAAKYAKLKKASLEMTKNWDDTFVNIQERRRKELPNKIKNADEARTQFVKDLTERNAKERAEVVKEARKILFYKKPQCRLINRALFTAECYRELDAQMEFNKTLEGLDKQQDKEYADLLKKDTENYFNEERKKADERLQKTRSYGNELKKQIEETGNDVKKLELIELRADQEDLKNMNEELKLIDQCEAELIKKKKAELKKMFIDSMDEKRRQEEKRRLDDDLQNRAIAAYTKAKQRLTKITKAKMEEERAEKIRRAEALAKKCAVIWESNEAEEEERLRKAVAEKDKIEAEKAETKRQFMEKIRADISKHQADLAAMKKKRAEEEKNLIAWETLQRYKRDEYNKEMRLKELQREWKKKIDMAADLSKQVEEQEIASKKEKMMNNESEEVKRAIDKTNSRVLAYAEEVLEESKGVRPLFPIIKAIEHFKRENRLLPPKPVEEETPPIRKRRMKKACSNPPPPEQTFYLG